MAESFTCTCGDVHDEHEHPLLRVAGGSTAGACTIEGCPCIQYEWDGEEADE